MRKSGFTGASRRQLLVERWAESRSWPNGFSIITRRQAGRLSSINPALARFSTTAQIIGARSHVVKIIPVSHVVPISFSR